jgi:hypothetical protein
MGFLGPASALFSEQTLSGLAAVAAMVILTFVLMRRIYRTPVGSGGRPGARREPAGRDERVSVQPLRGEAERLLVELQEFGREIEGRLETRIRHLAKLIAEADRAVERLNAAVAAARRAPEDHDRPSDALRARIVALRSEGMEAADIARTVGLPPGEVELVLGLERRVSGGSAE